ncbi:hypothetical protein AAY473_022910 [Plecturocebus cupreus]
MWSLDGIWQSPLHWITPRVHHHFGSLRLVDNLKSGVQDQPGQPGETVSLLKSSQRWWQVPVIPATWEAEAGELLQPRRRSSEAQGPSAMVSPQASVRLDFYDLTGGNLGESTCSTLCTTIREGLMEFHSCGPGWSAVMRSQLTAISPSRVQGATFLSLSQYEGEPSAAKPTIS